jgi:hypothetical protein
MLISYMTQMMVMFSVIIVVGLLLTWINDGLEHLFTHVKSALLNRKVPASTAKVVVTQRPTFVRSALPASIKITEKLVAHKPVTPEMPHHDYASKIVKIDLAPRSRVSRDEAGEKLGEHVTVLPKAA